MASRTYITLYVYVWQALGPSTKDTDPVLYDFDAHVLDHKAQNPEMTALKRLC